MAISEDPFATAMRDEMAEEIGSAVTIGNSYGEQSLNNEPLDVGALYTSHRELLQFIATRKFNVPEAEAEGLIQDVFLSYCQTTSRVENHRAWLVAAMCNACRHYWRRQGTLETLRGDPYERADPLSSELADKMDLRVTMDAVLSYLQPVCREAIRLHYYEGLSVADVARELSTTTGYAEKLVRNCLKRAQELCLKLQSGKTR